jgi:tetratricopeptide (TPR) repeat protein
MDTHMTKRSVFFSGLTSGMGICGPAMVTVLALALGVAVVGCGNKKEAEKAPAAPAAAPVSTGDPARDSFDQGVQFALKGQYKEAIEAYEKSISLQPKSAAAHSNLGFAYFDVGDFAKSAEHQKGAIAIDPQFASAYFGLAQALEKQGDFSGAMKNWQEYLKYGKPHSIWWNQAKAKVEEQAAKGKKK